MLFNSLIFLQFFGLFVLCYITFGTGVRQRNLILLIASYVFYGWWDARFLLLLLVSSGVDFFVGLKLGDHEDPRLRKRWVTVSMVSNLGILGFFKYFNFFHDSLSGFLNSLGMQADPFTLQVILPVGISFYTFQSMSYSIDIYRGKLKPTRDWMQFFVYVAFFPQLVAGPIERASSLLSQFNEKRKVNPVWIREGTWLVIWGFFKKVVLADNFSPLVEMAYHPDQTSGPVIFLGTLAFALQIYCDFSGYTDIARGLSRWLGFDLRLNFNLPYFACDLREFWQRWHISLSTWLRDYLYIPLGGNRGSRAKTIRNLMITLLLGGLWHGAEWLFVVWGLWHGFGLVCLLLWQQHRYYRQLPSIVGWAGTFAWILYGWLLFRATSMEEAARMTMNLANGQVPFWFTHFVHALLVFSVPLIGMQAWQAYKKDLMFPLKWRAWNLYALEGGMLYLIVLFWQKEGSPFIYFQF